jgi:hypothetical protein
MQKRNIILLLCALVIPIVSACQGETTPTPAPIPWTSTAPLASPSADPASIQQEKQAILQEIYTLVDQYNAFLEKEKSTGNYTIVQLRDGNEGVQYTNESVGRVDAEMTRVVALIAGLNKKYYALSIQENPPAAYPNSTYPNNIAQLNSEYSAWRENEIKNGSTVLIATENGSKHPLLIGDSHVADEEWVKQFDIVEARARQDYFASIDPGPDYEIIRRIEGAEVQITFKDVSNTPYRTGRPYTLYETATMYYTLDSTQHLVVGMSPIAKPQHTTGLSVPELEKLARDMIALVSPEIDLDTLTYSLGNKDELTFFFRWEDLTKPLLDDERSYPFVQVGLTGKGELLNYVNTLPMSR